MLDISSSFWEKGTSKRTFLAPLQREHKPFGKRSDKEKWYFKHLEVIQPFLICQIEKHVCFQVWPLHIFPVGSESDT